MEYTGKNINKAQQDNPPPQGAIATSAFAPEEDSVSVISSHTINIADTQTENLEKSFWQKATSEMTIKNGAKFGGTTLKEFLKFAKSNDSASANNALRAIVLASFDFIPYGMFISPIIGYIWEEQGGIKEQLTKLKDEINAETDKKIAQQHLIDLDSKFSDLLENLNKLENSVKSKKAEMYYDSQGSIEESRRIWVGIIESKFGEILTLAKQEKNKVNELPLYTQVATAHISFLKNLEINGPGPNYKFDPQSLKYFYNTKHIQETIDKYTTYIKNTFDDFHIKNIEKIYKVYGSPIDPYIFATSEGRELVKQKLNKLLLEAKATLDKINNETVWLGGWAAHGRSVEKATDELNNVKVAVNAADFSSKLFETTIADESFNTIASLGTWIEKDGKHYYNDRYGEMVTEWLNIGKKTYFFSPEDNVENLSGIKFKKGEMITGWVNTEENMESNQIRSYLFVDEEEGLKNSAGELFTLGQMMTGWHKTMDGKDKEFWYYFTSEEEGLKNSAGELFTLGQMMTGWHKTMDEKGKEFWYYFSPKEEGLKNFAGKLFTLGQMMTGTVKIGNKGYTFAENGVCTNPNI
ncbi:hypothetical protein EXW59_04070 (plasmid) [Bacillus mycoides]|uniref:insecticidal delta-endotoxin Cry8Ea1 family protein n=1 Tax=Bacillus mycoides TaxID=1405 RepID=UPI001C0229F7|nr:insecticidal delta-endotoxin Cry8Ea1 family protein [Bacillus mycoides]QWH75984.1 hypothetical protein EXW59_04070 [Bacillus mycoides]QWI47447.1 hypothetical protein EXW55_32075 [Bacillus mycoides]